jgi:hypothetical protein
MTVAGDATRAPAAGGDTAPARRARLAVAPVALVALVVSPIVIGALATVGETWQPMSDWAHMTYRVAQVGTRQTPLIGAYSFHGFAHPGPLSMWLAAPLYRLTGEEPRALLWTAAAVNVVIVAALAAVAWRRGRWPLLLATMLLVGLLVHGLGVYVVVDIWNPYLPLLPFLLTAFLAWDAALGRQRAVVEAIVPASLAAQAHIAFVPLLGAVALCAAGWRRWGARLVVAEPGRAPGPVTGPEPDAPDAPEAPHLPDVPDGRRQRWRAAVPPRALVLLGVLWVGPVLDALFDMHNPARVLRSLSDAQESVGVGRSPSLVGAFVGPGGTWVAGGEPVVRFTIATGGAVGLVAAAAALAGCLVVARRRRLPDVGALATLSLAVLVVAVVGTAQLLSPTPNYLTEWLKVAGGLVWFTAAWTLWRAAEPWVRAAASRRRLAAVAAAAAVVASAGWTWGEATRVEAPYNDGRQQLNEMRAAARAALDPRVHYRVEFAGGGNGHFPGFVYWLIRDGHDVVTSDGAGGLKWGHDHRWVAGEPYDEALVVAVHYEGSFSEAWDQCAEDPGMHRIYLDDPLSSGERRWTEELRFRRMTDPGSVTDADLERYDALAERGPQVALYTGDHLCGIPEAEDQRATGGG